MQYNDAINYIHNTHKFGIKLGLSNIEKLLSLLSNPHKNLKFVHVAGTNGKGSTVSFISNILMQNNLKVGIFTSPYIERFTERIKINNEEISKEYLSKLTWIVKQKIDIMTTLGFNHPTEFEIITAIAFLYFFQKNVDIVVLEVGLGGRFDSTNIINQPLVSVITTISYDHVNILGNTISEIAYQKAGIIKPGCDVVLYPQIPESYKVFEKTSNELKSPLHKVNFDTLSIKSFNYKSQRFDYGNYKDLEITLLGENQPKNAILAIKTVEILSTKGYNLNESSIKMGLKATKWPGRFEIICRNPMLLIDGAHNIEGTQSLMNNIEIYFKDYKKIFILGMLKDKDIDSVIEVLIRYANKIITITPHNERAINAIDLLHKIKQQFIDVYCANDYKKALDMAFGYSDENTVICAFGSLYYIGEIRKSFIMEV